MSSYAQNCTSKLQMAQQLFDSGQIEQIPSMLDSCLLNGFSAEERVKAFHLLLQVYLFDYNQTKADSLMVNFLNDYPTYKVKSSDPSEFVKLFNTYTTRPLWGVGVTLGTGISMISVVESFSTYNVQELKSQYKPYTANLLVGLRLDRYLNEKMWVTLGVDYSSLGFRKNEIFAAGKEELNYSEKTNWLTSNLTFNLGFGKSDFRPYGFLGAEVGYLNSARSEIRRSVYSTISYPEIVRPFSDIIHGRNNINFWALGGVGVQYILPKGSIKASLGYRYSIVSYVKPEFRYADSNVVQYYHFMEDDILLNHLVLNFSYSRVFYKIKKKSLDEN